MRGSNAPIAVGDGTLSATAIWACPRRCYRGYVPLVASPTPTNVIAHRGANRRARENTLEAFRAAVALGSDGIELDVRRTVDGALVIHHDAQLPDGRVIRESRRDELPD